MALNRRFASIVLPLVLLLVLACVSWSQSSDAAVRTSLGTGVPAASTAVPAADLRLMIEKQFGHHAALMIRVMRGKIDREPQFVKAAAGALQRNTEEITKAVAAIYGTSESAKFTKLWTQRTEALTAYSAARSRNDEEALAEAEAKLQAYPARYGDVVNELTRGKVATAPARQRISEHITVLVRATDSYAAANFPDAFAAERTAYSAMFDHGTAFAKAAVLTKLGYLPPAFDDRAARLRSGLTRLFGEHSTLAYEASRAVVASKPSAEAAANALNNNTQDILDAIGPAPARHFGSGWATYIDGLVDFAVAVAEFDTEGQSRARATLAAAPKALGARLAAVSGGKVTAGNVTRTLRTHNEQILREVTSYAAFDYGTSHELAYAQYDQMSTIAGTLAGVLEGFTAKKAPVGGAKTGGGGAKTGGGGSAPR